MEYTFSTAAELLEICKSKKLPISEVAKHFEAERSGKSLPSVRYKMKKTRDTMREAIERGVVNTEKSKMGMVGGDANKIYKSLNKMSKMIGSKVSVRAMAYALAVSEQNACMGRIVAFPTAGGAGVVPGVIFSASESFKSGKRRLIRGLFTASAIGLIIAEGATLSAAKGGCQAEVGAAVSMAAAGLTEMRKGTPEQCIHAAGMAMKSYLGLVCDPLGGLVEVPCAKRNAIGCHAAIAASDLAMSGIESFIPYDEIIQAMANISRIMSPKLRETALGGLAVTATGNRVKEKLGMRITPMD